MAVGAAPKPLLSGTAAGFWEAPAAPQARQAGSLLDPERGPRGARVMTRRGQAEGNRFPGANHGRDGIDCDRYASRGGDDCTLVGPLSKRRYNLIEFRARR